MGNSNDSHRYLLSSWINTTANGKLIIFIYIFISVFRVMTGLFDFGQSLQCNLFNNNNNNNNDGDNNKKYLYRESILFFRDPLFYFSIRRKMRLT